MKSVFVGNLPYAATEAELRELFERHGKVYDAKIKKDRETGRPLGYGFVLLDDEEAPRVMEALDGFCFGGRSLRVNESKERGRPPRVQGDRNITIIPDVTGSHLDPLAYSENRDEAGTLVTKVIIDATKPLQKEFAPRVKPKQSLMDSINLDDYIS